MVYIIISFIVSFILELLVIPKLIVISYKKKLFDIPNERKKHTGSVSRLGGASFFPILLLSLCISVAIILLVDPDNVLLFGILSSREIIINVSFLFSSLVILYFIGIADDLISVRYKTKLLAQLMCGIFVVISGVYLNDLGGFLGIYEIPVWLAYPFTVIIVIFIINAFNFIDGIDGLASGLGILALSVLGILFFKRNMFVFSVISFASLGYLIPFFMYNVFGSGRKRKKKIFMGDTGSLTIGMLLSFLTLRYSMYIPFETDEPANRMTFLVIFSVLLVPCLDVIRVVCHRVKNGKSPFFPDRNHFHHRLMFIGLSPRKTLIVILCLELSLIIINFILTDYIRLEIILLIDIIIYLAVQIWLNNKIKLNKSAEVQQAVIK